MKMLMNFENATVYYVDEKGEVTEKKQTIQYAQSEAEYGLDKALSYLFRTLGIAWAIWLGTCIASQRPVWAIILTAFVCILNFGLAGFYDGEIQNEDTQVEVFNQLNYEFAFYNLGGYSTREEAEQVAKDIKENA